MRRIILLFHGAEFATSLGTQSANEKDNYIGMAYTIMSQIRTRSHNHFGDRVLILFNHVGYSSEI